MQTIARERQWELLGNNIFDVAVIGGGINGACLYHHLCNEGFSVLLIDKSDFAGGTSQASAMMVWGGLLYLRNWDLRTVRRLCLSRDRMLRDMEDWVKPSRFRYIAGNGAGPGARLVHAALHLYWLIGGCRRRRPRRQTDFSEHAMLVPGSPQTSFVYEEACIEPSDARFVLHWLLPFHGNGQAALNYCSLEDATYDPAPQTWRLELSDSVIAKSGCARARWVVNAAGPWTDDINERLGLISPYKHVLSKGVFITVKRDPRHRVPLIFPTRTGADAMSLIPWGPVALWGPTETLVETVEGGFSAHPEDVRTLLEELNLHMTSPVAPESIVSLRCGVRPLAVDRSFNGTCSSLDLSRRHRIHRDTELPWISVYGGKLTDCVSTARSVVDLLKGSTSPSCSNGSAQRVDPSVHRADPFPGLREPVPDASWCAQRESCWTLEDYLRRRTNISQWVARGGLGQHDEHMPHLVRLAQTFHNGDQAAARMAVEAYKRKIRRTFDETIADA